MRAVIAIVLIGLLAGCAGNGVVLSAGASDISIIYHEANGVLLRVPQGWYYEKRPRLFYPMDHATDRAVTINARFAAIPEEQIKSPDFSHYTFINSLFEVKPELVETGRDSVGTKAHKTGHILLARNTKLGLLQAITVLPEKTTNTVNQLVLSAKTEEQFNKFYPDFLALVKSYDLAVRSN